MTPKQRAYSMRRKRRAGWTYQRIAEHYGITRQRVHAILKAKP